MPIMYQMEREEFNSTQEYIKKKAQELMSHEKKDGAIVGVPMVNYRVLEKSGRKFYSVQINTFMVIVDEHLHKAQNTNPEKFGTGDAHDMLEALRLITPRYNLERFTQFLSDEKCSYIFEGENRKVVDRVLRLDLFRLIKPSKNGQDEFIGGLFHALKHFKKNGINYSTGKGGRNLSHPQDLVAEIIEAFFLDEGIFEGPNKYVVIKSYDDAHNMKFVFYRELNTGVFFLDTAYLEEK